MSLNYKKKSSEVLIMPFPDFDIASHILMPPISVLGLFIVKRDDR